MWVPLKQEKEEEVWVIHLRIEVGGDLSGDHLVPLSAKPPTLSCPGWWLKINRYKKHEFKKNDDS